MPLVLLIKNNILVVGNLIQSWCLILGIFSAPLYLASIKCMSRLYITPSLPLSFRALQSYLPIHLKYAFFSENASIPNISCGNCLLCLGYIWGGHIFSFGLQLSFCQV